MKHEFDPTCCNCGEPLSTHCDGPHREANYDRLCHRFFLRVPEGFYAGGDEEVEEW